MLSPIFATGEDSLSLKDKTETPLVKVLLDPIGKPFSEIILIVSL